MSKPFENIDVRLSKIEILMHDLKNQPKAVEQQNETEQLLTVQEAAQFLNLTVPTIYSKVSKAELPLMKRSKYLYFSSIELMDYFKEWHNKPNLKLKKRRKPRRREEQSKY